MLDGSEIGLTLTEKSRRFFLRPRRSTFLIQEGIHMIVSIQRSLTILCVLGAAALLGPHLLRAQGSAAGSLVGLVQDTSGAAVPGATVTVRNLGTNDTRSETTGDGGLFTFPNLRPG